MAKKLIALLIVLAMTVSFVACGKKDTSSTTSQGNGSDQAITVSTQENTDSGATDSKTTNASDKKGTKATSGKTGTTSKSTGSISTVSRKVIGGNGSKSGTTAGSKGKTITAAVKNLKVTSGNSKVQNLDFGGKTFTMAITEEGQYNTQSFKRTVAAFETEYNCKISLKTLKFSTYNQQVAQAMSAGKPYDICYAHGSMFPACAIDKIYLDLLPTLRTADLMDNNNPTAGGIDLNKSSYFFYKNKLYGTCNFSSAFPYLIYYNKKAMSDAGFSGSNDPRKLAQKGKWTWSKIENMGKRLTDPSNGKYFLSNSFCGRGTNLSYGAPIVTVNNGNYSQNITSTAYINGLKQLQRLFRGSKPLAEPMDSAHAYNSYDTMLKGSAYMFCEESSKYVDMAKDVKSSSAFNRSKDNIGIVEMPLGGGNKKYPTGWLTAVCAGSKQGVNAALAWDIFRSAYVDPVQDSNAMSKTDKKYTDSLLEGDICCEVGLFATSDTTTIKLTEQGIIPKVIAGGDISNLVTQAKDKMSACIKATVKK